MNRYIVKNPLDAIFYLENSRLRMPVFSVGGDCENIVAFSGKKTVVLLFPKGLADKDVVLALIDSYSENLDLGTPALLHVDGTSHEGLCIADEEAIQAVKGVTLHEGFYEFEE